MENIASIKFTPSDNNTSIVDFDMPILITKVDGLLNIKLPFLGNLETFAKNEDDIDAALIELSDCFLQAAAKFGKGVHEELLSLGWSGTRKSVRFKLNDRD
ncbi:MAG: hypothetical protein ACXWEW_10875, partial [Nitrososphaeraceae archaeon]